MGFLSRLFGQTPKRVTQVSRSSTEPPASPMPPLPHSDPSCPYCHKALPKVPTRKAACPFCGNPILVRRTNVISPGIPLLTEADAHAADFLKTLQATHGEFAENRKALVAQWGRSPSAGDVAWRVVQHRIRASRQYSELKAYHWSAVSFLAAEGRDWLAELREAHRADLLGWKQNANHGLLDSASARVVVIATPNCCETCRKVASKKYRLDEALRDNPLPVIGCSTEQKGLPRGWCRCCYGLDV